MDIKDFDKSLFTDLKNIIATKIIIFTGFGSFLSGIINLVNERPLINILSSLGVSIIALILYFMKKKYPNLTRLGFIIFFINFYIPFGWLTSPGSTSAFPYYSFLLIMTSTLMIKNAKELIFPIFGIGEVLFLLRYEALNPIKFYHYTDRLYRANDLSVNFLLILSFMVYLLYSINKYTIKRDEILYTFSTTDQLTGLYNRRYLFDTLKKLNETNKNNHFSIAMIDVNKFKEINDNYGHMVGDKVLFSIGVLLKDFYKEEFIVGRYGGDEFMIIFPNKGIKEADKYLVQLEGHFAKLSKEFYDINLSFSFGLSDNQNKSVEEMIHTADRHLYKKRNIHI